MATEAQQHSRAVAKFPAYPGADPDCPLNRLLARVEEVVSPFELIACETTCFPTMETLKPLHKRLRHIRLMIDLMQEFSEYRLMTNVSAVLLQNECGGLAKRKRLEVLVNNYLKRKVAQDGPTTRLPALPIGTLHAVIQLCVSTGSDPLEVLDAVGEKIADGPPDRERVRSIVTAYFAQIRDGSAPSLETPTNRLATESLLRHEITQGDAIDGQAIRKLLGMMDAKTRAKWVRELAKLGQVSSEMSD